MKIAALVFLAVLWEAKGYPYYPYYGTNMDTLSYGSSDSNRGGMVLSRYYNPYYQQAMGGGMAAFMFRQPESQAQAQPSQYYLPDRRRQTEQQPYYPPQSPQENDVFYPPLPDKPITTPAPQSFDLTFPTERTELPTTAKVPELTEPEIEEVDEKSKKRVSKKKEVKKPVHEDDVDDDYPRMPTGAFFPMFFGYGRSNGGGAPGPMAIANAYSSARGGVASSHATAYGEPRPDAKYQYHNQKYQ